MLWNMIILWKNPLNWAVGQSKEDTPGFHDAESWRIWFQVLINQSSALHSFQCLYLDHSFPLLQKAEIYSDSILETDFFPYVSCDRTKLSIWALEKESSKSFFYLVTGKWKSVTKFEQKWNSVHWVQEA